MIDNNQASQIATLAEQTTGFVMLPRLPNDHTPATVAETVGRSGLTGDTVDLGGRHHRRTVSIAAGSGRSTGALRIETGGRPMSAAYAGKGKTDAKDA